MKAPRPRQPRAEHRLLRALVRFDAGWTVFAAAVCVISLAGFTPLALLNGMLGGAVLCAALGLFGWLVAVRHWARAGRRWRRVLGWAIALEQLVVLVIAAILLAQPPQGGWRCLERSEWSNTVLLHHGGPRQGWLFAHGGGSERAFVLARRTAAAPGADEPWRDLRYPGAAGWSLHLAPTTRSDILGTLWVAPRGHPELFHAQLDPAARSERWASVPRPSGWLRRVALTRRSAFVVVRNRLYRLWRRGRGRRRWRHLRCDQGVAADERRGAGLCSDVAVSRLAGGRELVLAVGSRWLQSFDGGARFSDVTPPGERPRLPRVAIGGVGWRYVFSGGLWAGSLFVAGPGEPFARRALPVRDVRVIVADPTQGARAMLGSWGEGIWLTEDGGRSWKSLGLRYMQVRSLAVDWRHRRAWAASANLLFHRGVYTRSF